MHFLAPALRLAAAVAVLGGLTFMQSNHPVRAVAELSAPFDPNAMDTAASVCTNFFGYATGTWRKNHSIPAAYLEYGYIEALEDHTRSILQTTLERARAHPAALGSEQQKIGAFYGACLDTAAIERTGLTPLATEFSRIAALQSRADIGAELAHLHAIGVDATFAVNPQPDYENSEAMIASIDQSGLGLSERDYYLRTDAASRKLRMQYRAHVTKMLAMSGDARAARDAQAAIALESTLAQASKPAADLRDPAAVDHPMRLAGFATLAPHVAFRTYFAAVDIASSGTINVDEPAFVRAVGIIAVAPLSEWRAYLRWHLIDAYARSLPKRFEDEAFAFNDGILSGAKEQPPRWKRCIVEEDRLLGEAVGRAYVAVAFPPSAKARALDMSQRIRAAYRAEMQALTWMSASTKTIAIAKLDATGLKVGYLDRWRSYVGYTVGSTSYTEDVLRGRAFASALLPGKSASPSIIHSRT